VVAGCEVGGALVGALLEEVAGGGVVLGTAEPEPPQADTRLAVASGTVSRYQRFMDRLLVSGLTDDARNRTASNWTGES
jgi:hypothetical protein